jgi:hypothetical protein
LDLILLP